MRLLVFGRTGQVGTELGTYPNVTALGRDAADLSDPGACAAIIAATDADAVINAAAWTAVDAAEDHEAEATVINATAPGAMATACAAGGIPFLHVSTDYVFDGSGHDPRAPGDATGPVNAYGRSKLAGELAVAAAGGAHLILRTSWVFSAHGSNFVRTMLRLAQTRDTLNVVDDQIGGPTPAADIGATLVALAAAMRDGQAGGIYHYAGAPAVSWAGFARETFAAAGCAVTVTGIPTAEYPTPARRPLNSRLDCAALAADFGITPPDWTAGLARVIAQLEGRA
jgi:dTDP-4-dehydrorhamnose reductase